MVAIPVVAVALAVGAIATPAWADCSPTDHCYGTGTYDGSNNTRQGVSSDVEIFDHSINSGFTENDVNMFLDSSDWMVAGYVVGSPAPCGGSTSVPRGCVEWYDGGHSDNSGFDCTPSIGSLQDTKIKNKDSGWNGFICGNQRGHTPPLDGNQAVPIAETEIIDAQNGYRGHYENLQYWNAASGTWNLWDAIKLTTPGGGSSNPITTCKVSDHEFKTGC